MTLQVPVYLVYEGGGGGHSTVHLLRATTLEDAVRLFCEHTDSDVEFRSDHKVSVRSGKLIRHYAHWLAYIEACWKQFGEWQIRRLDWPPAAGYAEAFVTEHTEEVASAVALCRPLLKQVSPTSRPFSFVWYLRSGTLVTFYTKPRDFEISVLIRFLIDKETREARSWDGGYQRLADELLV